MVLVLLMLSGGQIITTNINQWSRDAKLRKKRELELLMEMDGEKMEEILVQKNC